MECVLRELDTLIPREGRVLSVRGEIGTEALQNALRARGQEFDVAIVYTTRDAVSAPLEADNRPTLLTFASPSAVRHFVARNPSNGHAITIGETTARAAREAGFSVTVAPSSETQAFAASIREWVAQLQGGATCST
jgi:uroporphyrinogen-III synthase